jgi:hypothetical protein
LDVKSKRSYGARKMDIEDKPTVIICGALAAALVICVLLLMI